MNEEIKKILRPLYVPIANWHYKIFKAPKRYHHLYDTIRELKAKNILEIGVWNGKRGVRMIETAQEQVDDVQYFGYDLFEDLGHDGFISELSKMSPSSDEVTELLEAAGAHIHLYKGNTLATLPETVSTLPKMDFVFLDGGHSVETIANDWKFVEEVMDSHTVVIFDDYWRNRIDAGCKAIIDQIDTSKYDVTILPEIDTFNNTDFGRLEISFARVQKNS